MYEKPCVCGKSKKNFKFDIGPFFINICCRDAGYNEKGEKSSSVKEELKVEESQPVMELEVKQEEPKSEKKKNKKSKK